MRKNYPITATIHIQNFEAYLRYDEGVSYVDGVVDAESDSDDDGCEGERIDGQPQHVDDALKIHLMVVDTDGSGCRFNRKILA